MPYFSDTISVIVNRLNTQYFLPAVQRRFVWNEKKIVLLFDSIMRGYPISSFLFWELLPENRDKWEIFKFTDKGQSRGKDHEKAFPDGVQQLTLVLDGQQRLTSFKIGLQGSYQIHPRSARWDNPSIWPEHYLYLDLFKNPDVISQDEAGVEPHYGFKFFPKDRVHQNDADHYWFKVGRALDFINDKTYYEIRNQEEDKFVKGLAKEKENLFEQNLGRLHEVIWKDHGIISYYIEHDQDHDRVVDIFVRTNVAGVPLNKDQILMTMMTSKWTKLNARNEILELINHVSYNLTMKNSIDQPFVMKASLMLSDMSVRYLVQNFTNQNIQKIQDNWPEIKKVIIQGYQLINRFGIFRDNMGGRNALLPIIYYLYKHPNINWDGTTQFEKDLRAIIRRWFLLVQLNGVFGGSSDQTLTNMRSVLHEHVDEAMFPFVALNEKLLSMNVPLYIDESAYKRYLSAKYPDCIFQLSLLYDDFPVNSARNQIDHIFPQDIFSHDYMTSLGIPDDKQRHFLELKNCLGNLELLLDRENNEKRATPFDKWLPTRDSEFCSRHLIPSNPKLLKFENFDKFIEAREALIIGRLKMIMSAAAIVK